jgi:Immunity protein 35
MVVNDVHEARVLVEQHLARTISPPIEVAIRDEFTRETDFGWVFFYNSKRYIETGVFSYALAGNAPVIVDRRDGSVTSTATAVPVEVSIERYRKAHPVLS